MSKTTPEESRQKITQAELKELLHYDEATGIFTRLKALSRKCKVGERVGSVTGDGYLNARLNRAPYMLHRLAWLYVYGSFPKKLIDHINGNPADNRICNLREATNSENLKNSKLPITSTSGVKGVYWKEKYQYWEVYCRIDGKTKYGGSFKTLQEASVAVEILRKKHHGEFARHAVAPWVNGGAQS